MSDCDLWPHYCTPAGYGQRRYLGKVQSAHRARFHEVFGWWPDTVRHTCDNPGCVNIWHLVPGTQHDNVGDMLRRGRQNHQAQTHCKRGHPFSEANTYVKSNGARECRACSRTYKREWKRAHSGH